MVATKPKPKPIPRRPSVKAPVIPPAPPPAVPPKARKPGGADISVTLAIGKNALTADEARKLLGWEEVSAKAEDTVPEIYSIASKHVRLLRDPCNRPLTTNWLLTLRQELLNRRWRFNGESITIGTESNVLDGQHRLISLVLAEIEWSGRNQLHWKELWKKPPTMEAVIVYGVSEDDDTFKTFNSGKAGTLADTLYRSEYFNALSRAERLTQSRAAEFAMKLLWGRLQKSKDFWAPDMTQGEAMDFLTRHPRVLQAVQYITKLNGKENVLAKYLSSGTCAGLMYLMGASASDVDAYRNSSEPSDEILDWSNWDHAVDFWKFYADRNPAFLPLNAALSALEGEDGLNTAKPIEKVSLFAKAWIAYLDKKEITHSDLELKYRTLKNQDRVLEEFPTIGGIDLGPAPKKTREGDEASGGEVPSEDSPSVMEQRKEEERKRREEAEAATLEARKKRAAEVAEKLKAQRAEQARKKAEREANPAPNNRLGGAPTPRRPVPPPRETIEPVSDEAPANGEAPTEAQRQGRMPTNGGATDAPTNGNGGTDSPTDPPFTPDEGAETRSNADAPTAPPAEEESKEPKKTPKPRRKPVPRKP